MFLTLLLVTFGIALLVSFLCVRLFQNPIASILDRIISDSISSAWVRYLTFAIYVTGISGGVRIHALERFVLPDGPDQVPLVLDVERWVLEIYRTIIESLQAIAWMLLVFFVFALIAYVIVRFSESRRSRRAHSTPEGSHDAQ